MVSSKQTHNNTCRYGPYATGVTTLQIMQRERDGPISRREGLYASTKMFGYLDLSAIYKSAEPKKEFLNSFSLYFSLYLSLCLSLSLSFSLSLSLSLSVFCVRVLPVSYVCLSVRCVCLSVGMSVK